MSLIHEALEKIEQSKGRKSPAVVPTFSSSIPRERERTPETSKTVYGIVGVLLFSLVLGLVYLIVNPPRPVSVEQKVSVARPLRPSFPSAPSFSLNQEFVLTGVTRVGRDWTAIVNNQMVRMGEEVGGATVKSIDERNVVLEFEGRMVRLNLHGGEVVHLTSLDAAPA